MDLIATDPVLLTVSGGLHAGLFGTQCIVTALAYVRALGLADHIEKLPRGAGLPALVRGIETDLGRGRPTSAPFSAPVGWRLVATVAELWALGHQMQNCLGGLRGSGMDHTIAFLEGREVILVSATEPVVMASIALAGPSLWHMEQCVAHRNAPAPSGTCIALEQALGQAGVRFVRIGCADALEHVAFRTESGARRRHDRVLDDALGL